MQKGSVFAMKKYKIPCDILSKGAVTITEAGTYLVTGTLENGTLIVDADKSDKVQIILENAQITRDDSAALSICQADKVFVTLAEGSQNHLSSTGTFEKEEGDDNIDGAVFSRDDLTFNGSGSLVIASLQGHGIVGKDDLVITGGSFEKDGSKNGEHPEGMPPPDGMTSPSGEELPGTTSPADGTEPSAGSGQI